MKNKILLFFLSLLFAGNVIGQGTRIGQHDAVKSWKAQASNIAAAEGKQIGQEIIEVMGLKPNFEIMAANVPNAAAVVYGGKRYILYNPNFIDRLIRATGTRWAAVSVLAHEIGHHLNGHTIGNTGSQQKLELEADEFSGFVLRKMGASLGEAQVAMKLASGERASRTHPGQQDRLVAIQKGWEQAHQQSGGSVASAKPNHQPKAQRQQPATRTSGAAIASRNILGVVRFHSDPNKHYYVTTQYNLVRVVNNQLSIIGKLSNSNSKQFPYIIHDNRTQLLVDRGGKILTTGGKQVGRLTARG
jgi:hypothetical protein